MLKSIMIEGLFGVSGNTKHVRFNQDLTLLVGENGSGKTTVLNMLNNLVRRRFTRLRDESFSKITLEMTSGILLAYPVGARLVVCYADAEERIARELKAQKIHVTESVQRQVQGWLRHQSAECKVPARVREAISRFFVCIDDSDEPDTTYDHFVMEGASLYFPTYRRFEMDLRQIVGGALGVEESYLFHMISRNVWSERTHGGVVIGVSNEDIDSIVKQSKTVINQRVQERLRNLISEYTLSLFDVSEPKPNVPRDPRELEITVIEGFKKAGIITSDQDQVIHTFMKIFSEAQKQLRKSPVGELKPRHIEAILMFNRLRRFADLYDAAMQQVAEIERPITRLQETLSSFLNKHCSILKDGTLVFSTDNDNILTLEALSAGEKQLVALLVYVGLDLDRETVVLIDEPELSLHISWQRRLLETLLQLADRKQLIVSTHSPSIIGTYRDRMQVLGEVED